MPEIAILEQNVLTGIIEKYTAPPEMIASALFRRSGHPYTTAKWDVLQGNRKKAHFTMPNREGKVVEQMGVGSKTASFLYIREKKAFEPTTLRWLRTPGEMAQANAEFWVRRELADLNNRIERQIEATCWDALKGTITVNEPDVKAVVDLGVPGSHKPTAGTEWDHITSSVYDADVIGNIKAWKKLVAEDSGSELTDIYLTSGTMTWVDKNGAITSMFTDRYKDEFLKTGNISGLLGLNWHIHDGGYVDDGGSFVGHLDDNHVLLVARNSGSFELLEGLSADMDAPEGHTGKFAKSWETKDPSAMFSLVEYSFIPILKDATAVIYATVAS